MAFEAESPGTNGSSGQWHRYFESRLKGMEDLHEERDRRYEERFQAQRAAVEAAFEAQQKLNTVIDMAAKEAITKAETAQHEYNQHSNEIRQALSDQTKNVNDTMMSRVEAVAEYKSLHTEMDTLRDHQSQMSGRSALSSETRAQTNWSTSLIVVSLFSLLSFLLGAASLLLVITRHP